MLCRLLGIRAAVTSVSGSTGKREGMLAVLTQRSHPRARALLAHSCRSEVLLMVPAHAGAVSSSFGAYNGRHRSALAHVRTLQGIGIAANVEGVHLYPISRPR